MSLATLVVRRRGIVATIWLAAALALSPFAARIERVLDVSAVVPSSESAQVERLLAERFHSPFAHYAILVAHGLPSPSMEPGQIALGELADSIAAVPGVTRVLSYLDGHDSIFLAPAQGGATFLVVGLDPGRGALDALVPPLRQASNRLVGRLAARHPGIRLQWTGETPLNYDLRRTSATDARRAELRAMPLTLVLLGLAFGSLVAALLPAAAGTLAIVVTLGVIALIATHMSLSMLVENVVSMLGLGLGIDYALLIVSRFRDETARGLAPEDAAIAAARHAGHTVVISGTAVAIGFAALTVVPLNELRAIAIGGLLVSLFSVLTATTLLPGVLAWLGPRADAGRLRRRRVASTSGDGWHRWGVWIAGHPWRILIGLGAPVLALALQARHLSTDLPRGDWLPPSMESAQALATLRSQGKSSVLQTIRVVVELPRGSGAFSADGWQATKRATDWLAADPRLAVARSLPGMVAELAGDVSEKTSPQPVVPDSDFLAALPPYLRHTFTSDDERMALIELVPRESAQPSDLSRLISELRSPAHAGLSGVRFRVGGLPAFNVDYRNAIERQVPLVVLLVIGGTFLALLVGFRSILIPLKAVALNLLTVGASIGALTLVFQDGHGSWVLGVDGGVGSVFPLVPILVFCTTFGLSIDYEVFLVARVAEARRAGLSESEALATGLQGTGQVITRAAVIMVVVFAAFTMGDFLLMKMLGFTLATAVLLDATVVRVALGPALLRLAGEWNWWMPFAGRRRVTAPRIDLSSVSGKRGREKLGQIDR